MSRIKYPLDPENPHRQTIHGKHQKKKKRSKHIQSYSRANRKHQQLAVVTPEAPPTVHRHSPNAQPNFKN